MSSKFDIISQALVLIGESPISSFSEGTAGTVANQLYDITYEGLLTKHRWRFAIGKQALSKLSSTPLNEWKNAFQIPSELLLVIKSYPRTTFEVYEDQIYANVESLSIDYLYKPDEGRLPAYFVEALAARLAEVICIPITNNQSLKESMAELSVRRFNEAAYADSQGRFPSAIQSRPFIDVRR